MTKKKGPKTTRIKTTKSEGDIIVFTLDRKYCYTSFNSNLKKIIKSYFNFDLQVGMNAWKIIELPELRAIAKKSMTRAMKGESYSETHFEHNSKNYFEIIWIPIILENEITGISAYIKNITERKKIEENIKFNEDRYHSLISKLLFGVLVQGPNAEILISNSKALELLGLTEDQLLGKSSFDKDWNVIHEDGTPYLGPTHPVPVCIATRKPVRDAVMGVFRPLTHDRVWLLVNADPVLNKDGSVKEVICTFKDITEQENLKLELKESESNLKRAQKIARIGSWFWHAETNEFSHSEEILNILGVDNVDCIRTPELMVANMVHPDDRQLVMEAGLKAIETGVGLPLDYRIIRPNGKEIWVRVTSEVEIVDGKPIKMFGITQDITRYKKAQQALSESENKYRFIAENTSDGIATFGPDYKVTYSSPSYKRQMGYNSNEEIGRGVEEIAMILHPDDRDEVIGKIFNAINFKIPELNLTFQVKTKSENYIWREDYFTFNYDRSGNFIGAIDVCRDVTERKLLEEALIKSESTYRSILHASPDDITITDLEGRIVMYSPSALTMFGYEENDDLVGRSVFDFIAPIDHERAATNLITIFSGEKLGAKEYLALRKDGSVFNVEAHAEIIKDIDGKPLQLLLIVRDISERVKSEKALKVSEQKYRELVRNLPSAVAIQVDGKVVFVNEQAKKLTGVKSNKEIIGKDVLSFVHPDSLELVMERLRTLEKKEEEYEFIEVKYIRPDRSVVEVEVKAVPVLFENKEAVMTISNNITERKKLLQALVKSEATYRSILTASPDNICITDLAGHVQMISPSGIAMFDYESENELIGRDLLSFIIGSERERAAENISLMFQGIYNRIDEYHAIKKDGSIINIEANGEIIRDSLGNPVQMVFVVRDVTERRKQELELLKMKLKYDKLVERISIGVYILHSKTDGNFHFDYVSPRMAEILNEKAEDIIRDFQFAFKAFHPDEMEGFTKLNLDAISRQVPTNWIGRIIVNGEVKWIHIDSTPEVQEKGDVYWHGVMTDITKEKEIEHALRESEIKYKDLVENSPSAVAIHVNGIVVYLNKQAILLLRAKSDADIIGKPVLSVVHPDSREAVINRIKTIGEQVHEHSFLEEKFIRFDGTVVDVEVKAVPIIYENKEAVLTITNDISQRKQSEIAVEENRAKYMALSDASFDAIFLSVHGICFEQNQMAERMFGYTNEEAIGRSGADWLIPEDREMVIYNMKAGYTEPYEAIALRKDGSTFPCMLHGKTMSFKGRTVRVTSLTDISKRKQAEKALVESERKYRELVENSPDAIVIYREDLVVFANKQCIKLLGAVHQNEILGKNVLSFVHPDYTTLVIERMAMKMVSHDPLSILEEKIIRLDNSEIDVEVKAIPIEFENKPAIQLIITDISERKKAQAELIKLNRLLKMDSEINDLILRSDTNEELFKGVCNTVVANSNFRMIWIGSVNEVLGTVSPHTWAGFENGYIGEIGKISLKDKIQGNGPSAKAIRYGDTFVCNDIETDPTMLPWKDEAVKRNYLSSIAIPIKIRNKPVHIFNLYSDKKNFFANKEEVVLLENIAENIAFSLVSIENEKVRKQTEMFKALSAEILEILNNSNNLKEIIHNVLASIHSLISYSAVGIRLKEGDDYPYFEQKGFSQEFLTTQNKIAATDEHCQVCRDNSGKAILECLCGLVISGKSEGALPSFTKTGSFWTNNSSTFLELLPEEDPRFHPRNRCIHSGYHSIAIIPIRANDEIVGTLQINDKDKDVFTLEMIEYFEDICVKLGIALMRRQAEENLQNKMEELIVLNKKLEQFAHANQELEQFAYIASHELQTPIRTISNYMHIFKEDYSAKLDENAMKFLNIVDNSAGRMSKLINSLMYFAQLGLHKTQVKVDIKAMLDELISDLEIIPSETSPLIEVCAMPELMVFESEIHQLFQNLITNAIKFQPKGQRPIIKICSQEIENGWQFSLSDNGIGIDPNYFDRVFDIFQRLHNGEKEFAGNGIGLAYCKKIVQLHKGKIWVESSKGKGSTFYFTIINNYQQL